MYSNLGSSAHMLAILCTYTVFLRRELYETSNEEAEDESACLLLNMIAFMYTVSGIMNCTSKFAFNVLAQEKNSNWYIKRKCGGTLVVEHENDLLVCMSGFLLHIAP